MSRMLRTARNLSLAVAVHGGVQRRQRGRWAEHPAPADAPGITDRLDALERLGRLRDSGVLSDAEFAAEKARILTS